MAIATSSCLTLSPGTCAIICRRPAPPAGRRSVLPRRTYVLSGRSIAPGFHRRRQGVLPVSCAAGFALTAPVIDLPAYVRPAVPRVGACSIWVCRLGRLLGHCFGGSSSPLL